MLVAGLLAGALACGGNPFGFAWIALAERVQLFALSRPELNVPSGYNFFQGTTVRVESPGSSGTWDVAVDTRDGELVLVPPGALGIDSRARITTVEGLGLREVLEAPSDTTVFIADRPVPLRMGVIYVVRTGRSAGSFGAGCVYFAKLEPITIDVEEGIFVFDEITNPVCNDPRLVPPTN